ncbi:MAG: peptide chain release factor N(5)-glutamine methyltransferase [Thermomicrobiales bacterium]|nr:peptide chain release factor N(5)-glutamine methyltransferase [Thermomicrobiales bacterium]
MTSPHDQTRWTVARALRTARGRLAAAGLEGPGLDAEVLLRHLLGWDRTQILSRPEAELPAEVVTRYEALIGERLEGSPVAYLTGEREFMGLTFQVTPAVLVPRPETEILVEWAADWLRPGGRRRVVDVGTGSGAIALSLVTLLGPDWRGEVTGIDLSPEALAVAERNRATLGQVARVALRQGSLLRDEAGPFDLVLANLPYLRPEQIADNPDLAAEPRLALDGGADGLDLVRELLADAPRVLAPGGAIGLEIDPGQADAVQALALAAFPEAAVTVLHDLAGHARHVIIETGEA